VKQMSMSEPILRYWRARGLEKLLSRKHYTCKCSEGRVPVYFGQDPDGECVEVHCSRCNYTLHTMWILPVNRFDLGA